MNVTAPAVWAMEEGGYNGCSVT